MGGRLRPESAAGIARNMHTDEELWNFFQNINADYLIDDKKKYETETLYYRKFLVRNKEKLELIFANDDFDIFKINFKKWIGF